MTKQTKPTEANNHALLAAIKQYPDINPNQPLKPGNPNSLSGWMQLYFLLNVNALSPETQKAKRNDLTKFLFFYRAFTQSDHLPFWISSVTTAFRDFLLTQSSSRTGQLYKATTVNRILKTLKHFASWLSARHPLTDGDPTTRIKFIIEDEPQWLGLTPQEIEALEKIVHDPEETNKRNKKNKKLENALFYCLLHTGLRESELIHINIDQYTHGGFSRVIRKNHRVSSFIPLPSIAKQYLDRYLAERTPALNEPLFVSRAGLRISAREVRRTCDRLAKRARLALNNPSFHFSPHQLRHTFLKRVTDKHGLHVAHRMSGNVSIKEIFRYAKPSQREINDCAENLFS